MQTSTQLSRRRRPCSLSDRITQRCEGTHHLFLIPIIVNARPDSNNITPLIPIAGVKLGWRGNGFSEAASTSRQSTPACVRHQLTHLLNLLAGVQSMLQLVPA